jgi:hypothetical protein
MAEMTPDGDEELARLRAENARLATGTRTGQSGHSHQRYVFLSFRLRREEGLIPSNDHRPKSQRDHFVEGLG